LSLLLLSSLSTLICTSSIITCYFCIWKGSLHDRYEILKLWVVSVVCFLWTSLPSWRCNPVSATTINVAPVFKLISSHWRIQRFLCHTTLVDLTAVLNFLMFVHLSCLYSGLLLSNLHVSKHCYTYSLIIIFRSVEELFLCVPGMSSGWKTRILNYSLNVAHLWIKMLLFSKIFTYCSVLKNCLYTTVTACELQFRNMEMLLVHKITVSTLILSVCDSVHYSVCHSQGVC
jgi:hypothetical protein